MTLVIHFEWDPVKASTNHRKHGVTFEDATRIFADPYALTEPDRIDERGELRWRIIGAIEGFVFLVVIHAIRERGDDEVIRIISARGANRKERRRYEEARAQNPG